MIEQEKDRISDMSDFRITYDGPALNMSEMDVRELAPALLAIGDLLTASVSVLCGDKIQPQVNVKGSFKTGAKTEYEVVRVIEHRSAARQIPLPGL